MASSAVVCLGRFLVLNWMWYPVEKVDVLDYVEHVVGSGPRATHNLNEERRKHLPDKVKFNISFLEKIVLVGYQSKT